MIHNEDESCMVYDLEGETGPRGPKGSTGSAGPPGPNGRLALNEQASR